MECKKVDWGGNDETRTETRKTPNGQSGPRAHVVSAVFTHVEHERVGAALGVCHLEPHVGVADGHQRAAVR